MSADLELCIPNAGPFVRVGQLEKILRDAGMAFAALNKRPTEAFAYVLFNNAEDLEAAKIKIPTLAGPKCKAFNVRAAGGQSHFVNGVAKNNQQQQQQRSLPAPSEGSGSAGPANVQEVLTPWLGVPYDQQLSAKHAEMADVLRAIALRLRAHILRREDLRVLKRDAKQIGERLAGHKRPRPTDDAEAPAGVAASPIVDSDAAVQVDTTPSASSSSSSAPAATAPVTGGGSGQAQSTIVTDLAAGLPPSSVAQLPDWLLALPKEHGGMMCPLLPIRRSPQTEGYRNKASFTIGWAADGAPLVGSRLGSFKDGLTLGPPDEQVHLPRQVIAVAHAVTRWLQASPLAPYNMVTHVGAWRGLTVRWAESTQQCMVILVANPPGGEGPVAGATGAPAHAAGASEGSAAEAAPAEAEGGASEAGEAAAPCSSMAVDTSAAAAPAEGEWSSPVAASAAAAILDVGAQREVYRSELRRLHALLSTGGAVNGDAVASSSSASSSSPSSFPLPAVHCTYVQEYSGVSQPPANHPHIPLLAAAGATDASAQALAQPRTIREVMCGLQFDLSPGAFFQVNTPAAEELYALVRDLALRGRGAVGQAVQGGADAAAAGAAEEAAVDGAVPSAPATEAGAEAAASSATPASAPSPPQLAVVDVCCGTGTIGLVCAVDPSVARVVGVELSSEAIDDAKANAALNGLADRAVFVCDRAENAMKAILDTASAPVPGGTGGKVPIKRVTAIVDPPRSGLHASVIKALRTCKPLKRLVYVSCNPTGSFIEDAVRLSAPQEDSSAFARGPPLRPVLAIPVDLFPHTPHTELVVLFERE